MDHTGFGIRVRETKIMQDIRRKRQGLKKGNNQTKVLKKNQIVERGSKNTGRTKGEQQGEEINFVGR